MNRIKTVIIDDEYFNREVIATLINRARSNFELCGTAGSVREGLKIIEEVRPDVVFIDIKMPDGTGFDLLRKIGTFRFEVIFVTGFDDYALQAFDFNAVDYVLKPIDIDKFRLTLERVEQRLRRNDAGMSNQLLSNFSENGGLVTRIPVSEGGELVFLKLSDIVSIEEKNDKTIVVTQRGNFVSQKPLHDMALILERTPEFLKAGNNSYINAVYVERISKDQKKITMINKSEFDISLERAAELIDLISRNRR